MQLQVGSIWHRRNIIWLHFFHEEKGAKGKAVESLYHTLWPESYSVRFLPRKCILQRCPVSLG